MFMESTQPSHYLFHPNLLLIVSHQGVLIELFTPVRGVVNNQSDALVAGINIWVEAVVACKEHKIVYLVLGRWLPHYHIDIIIR